jgi:hypothetical protein
MYKVESNIEAPSFRRGKKYPFADMAVGDSFLVPNSEITDITYRQNSIRGSALSYGKKNNAQFSTRRTEEGLRCWRVA